MAQSASDRVTVNIAGFRDRIERCRNDVAWRRMRTADQIVVLMQERLDQIAPEPLPTGDEAVRSVLRKIAKGERPSPGEVAIAAAELDVDSDVLMKRAIKAKEANGTAS